jgi:beta-glucosidase
MDCTRSGDGWWSSRCELTTWCHRCTTLLSRIRGPVRKGYAYLVDLNAVELAGRWWWGAGASAVQTEGASPADDWYRWERQGRAPLSADGNGFFACYERDFALVHALGITDYRLSVNWARVIPEPGQVDREAVVYYREVLEAGSAAGLRMWICLLHSAIPTWFADAGGFAGEKALDAWLGWVDTAAALFADLAGGWMPFNTPTSYVQKAYLAGTFPPGQRDPNTAAAVLRTVHLCDFEAAVRLRWTGRPVCSNEALMPILPADQSAPALAAARRLDAFVWSSWLDLARQPRYQTAFDLYGFTYYYASRVTGDQQLLPHPADHEPGPLGYVPWADGIALVLERLHRELPDARFVVAEVGCAGGPETDDAGRCDYLRQALGHVAAAQDDGMRIEGVSLWTAVDNYEWLAGFDVSFGLFTRSRKPRRSAEVMRKAIQGG